MLLSWIYYHSSTVLYIVPLGSSKRHRRDAICIYDTRVWWAFEVRQNYLYKIIRIHWKLPIPLFICTHILPQCVVHAFKSPCNLDASIVTFFDRYTWPGGSWRAMKTNMAFKCFYEFMLALNETITIFRMHLWNCKQQKKNISGEPNEPL